MIDTNNISDMMTLTIQVDMRLEYCFARQMPRSLQPV